MAADTKFKKGQSGNPAGRKKGSKNGALVLHARDIQVAAGVKATEMLEGMLKKAQDTIDEALDDGNQAVAMWVIDRIVGKRETSMLPEALDITLSTIDDVLQAAQMITEMVMLRKLSIDDGEKSLRLLSQYSSFRAFERIDELKEAVDEMRRMSEAKIVNSDAVLPSWGRLSENTKTANKVAAE